MYQPLDKHRPTLPSTVGNPAVFPVQGPWLCVPPSRAVCHFVVQGEYAMAKKQCQ